MVCVEVDPAKTPEKPITWKKTIARIANARYPSNAGTMGRPWAARSSLPASIGAGGGGSDTVCKANGPLSGHPEEPSSASPARAPALGSTVFDATDPDQVGASLRNLADVIFPCLDAVGARSV